jgi:nitroreductase
VILESIRLSASSIGLQPYRVIVIEDSALLEQIKPIANNQAQITEASHLLVFAAWDNVTEDRVDDYLNLIARERNVSLESLGAMKNYLSSLTKNSAEQNFNWAARQAYIALGTGLIAAASQEVDATPMEGFNAPALDELLGLAEKGLKSVSILPLGYRDAEQDWLVKQPKVRTPKQQFFLQAN